MATAFIRASASSLSRPTTATTPACSISAPRKAGTKRPTNSPSKLDLDDKLLRDILKDLYYPDSPYVFSALPADVLGQVYEQFLGKVIRLTPGHRAEVEEKPEVKKAGGVYYTPTYIVEYIVQNTVGQIARRQDAQAGRQTQNPRPRLRLRLLSLGAYEYLLKWHRDYYTQERPRQMGQGRPAGARADRPAAAGNSPSPSANASCWTTSTAWTLTRRPWRPPSSRFLLKVLEGETSETIQPELRLFTHRALPDLGDNIKCGNSLIGPDFYQQQQMTLLDEEERYRVNVFDWAAEFPEIFKSGGFDAVIGNPPIEH